jgi:DNA polymerase I-like protein with 3'-5' exonuclease and polymerase domains
MDAILQYVGLPREEVYTTNLYCRWDDTPSEQKILECAPRWLREIKAVKPKVIVGLGDIVTKVFMPEHKFGNVRGGAYWLKEYGCWFIPTYHPAAYLYKDAKLDIAEGVRDFRKFLWYVDKPRDFGVVRYEVLDTELKIEELQNHLWTHQGSKVAIDVETTYDHETFLSVSFACSHGTYHIPQSMIHKFDWSRQVGNYTRWTFHNGMFDSPQIKKHFGVYIPIIEDTMMMSYSLDERGGRVEEDGAGGDAHGVGIHGLKKLAREYCGAGWYASSDKRPQDMDPEELAMYNSKDVAYTLRLADMFEAQQIEDDVRDMYMNLLIPAVNVHAKITANGAHIDRKELNKLKLDWLPQWLKLEKALVAQARAVGFPGRINLKSPAQLAKVIYELMDAPHLSTKPRTTEMAVLKEFAKEDPDARVTPELHRFAIDLLALRGLSKDIDTYIKGIEDDMDANDDIHPEPDIHGTRNGRLAYKKPPVMTIPKPRTVGAERARIRRIFASRNVGTHLIMEADFRQAELWAAYFVSHDELLLDDLNSGDFHARGAQAAFEVNKGDLDPLMWELYRDSYKIVVYGSFYGAGPDALVGDKALTGRGSTGSYILLKTKKEAQKVLDNFNSRYARLYAWREAEKVKVKREGEQANLNGRKRRYHLVRSPQQLNQAINTPISSLSHDHLMVGWIELGGWDWTDYWKEPKSLLDQYDSRMWFEVHDSVVIEASREHLKEVADLVTKTLSKPRFGLSIGIPVDIKVGPNWLEVDKLEKYLDHSSVA